MFSHEKGNKDFADSLPFVGITSIRKNLNRGYFRYVRSDEQ